MRTIITDFEIRGLLETRIESRDEGGRVKQVQTIFEPRWVDEALQPYAEASDILSVDEN